jgi:hypothetical protein
MTKLDLARYFEDVGAWKTVKSFGSFLALQLRCVLTYGPSA